LAERDALVRTLGSTNRASDLEQKLSAAPDRCIFGIRRIHVP